MVKKTTPNVAKRIKQEFFGGPWHGGYLMAWPRQLMKDYELESGTYIRDDSRDYEEALTRTYRWNPK